MRLPTLIVLAVLASICTILAGSALGDTYPGPCAQVALFTVHPSGSAATEVWAWSDGSNDGREFLRTPSGRNGQMWLFGTRNSSETTFQPRFHYSAARQEHSVLLRSPRGRTYSGPGIFRRVLNTTGLNALGLVAGDLADQLLVTTDFYRRDTDLVVDEQNNKLIYFEGDINITNKVPGHVRQCDAVTGAGDAIVRVMPEALQFLATDNAAFAIDAQNSRLYLSHREHGIKMMDMASNFEIVANVTTTGTYFGIAVDVTPAASPRLLAVEGTRDLHYISTVDNGASWQNSGPVSGFGKSDYYVAASDSGTVFGWVLSGGVPEAFHYNDSTGAVKSPLKSFSAGDIISGVEVGCLPHAAATTAGAGSSTSTSTTTSSTVQTGESTAVSSNVTGGSASASSTVGSTSAAATTGDPGDTKATSDAGESSGVPIGVILAVVGGVVLLLLCLIVLAVVLVRRHKDKEHNSSFLEVELSDNSDYGTSSRSSMAAPKRQRTASGNYTDMASSLNSDSDASPRGEYSPIKGQSPDHAGGPSGKLSGATTAGSWEIRYDEMELVQEIGAGAFGTVLLGRWRDSDVAVKQLLQSTAVGSAESREEFIHESATMAKLRPHANVVGFLGVCTAPDTPWCLVTEFIHGGSLHSLLVKIRETHDFDLLSNAQIMSIFAGTASGMGHLSAEGIIHRDLAARNVLLQKVGASIVPKIADFGMSRVLLEDAQGGLAESGQTKSTIAPLKWLAPESIRDRIYSEKSDVWAYGVMIVEVVNVDAPYGDLDPVGAAARVLSRELRGPPLSEMGEAKVGELGVDKVLNGCFEWEPKVRLSFRQIYKLIDVPVETLNRANDISSHASMTPTQGVASPEPPSYMAVPPDSTPQSQWPEEMNGPDAMYNTVSTPQYDPDENYQAT